MKTRIPKSALVGATAVLASAGFVAAAADHRLSASLTPAGTKATTGGKVVRLKDARLKFEFNATDKDAGVQLFVDADEWRDMTLYDPKGKAILTTTTQGRMAKQGGTELFLESAEPTLAQVSLPKLFRRWPAGKYRIRGNGLHGERLVGSAILTHAVPDGPQLVSPLGTQVPANDLTVSWKPVTPPAGGAIVGYEVLVVRPASGIKAIPKVTLDVTMPPTATSLKVPPGFLQPGIEYEWEVLAIDQGGNQTLSSSTFTTAP